MQGLHIVADLDNCRCAHEHMTDLATFQNAATSWIELVGLTPLKHCFHQFINADGSKGGITGVIVLAESHLAIHTWPESKQVTLDVYVCNFGKDNTASAHQLIEYCLAFFLPTIHQTQILKRGQTSHIN